MKELFEQTLKDKLKNEIYSGEQQIGLSKKNERKIREGKERKIIQEGLKTFHEELENVINRICELKEQNNNSNKKIIESEKNIMKHISEVLLFFFYGFILLFTFILKLNITFVQKNKIIMDYEKKEHNIKEKNDVIKKSMRNITIHTANVDEFMKSQALKKNRDNYMNDLNSKISHESKAIERIKLEINQRNQFLINLRNKKIYIKDCLRDFYLQTLKNFKRIDNYNGEISEVIYSLWNLKYKIKNEDFPELLDAISKEYILSYAHHLRKFKELSDDKVKQKELENIKVAFYFRKKINFS